MYVPNVLFNNLSDFQQHWKGEEKGEEINKQINKDDIWP